MHTIQFFKSFFWKCLTDYLDYKFLEYVHSDRTIFPKRSREKKSEERREVRRSQHWTDMKPSLWKDKRSLRYRKPITHTHTHTHTHRAAQKSIYNRFKQ